MVSFLTSRLPLNFLLCIYTFWSTKQRYPYILKKECMVMFPYTYEILHLTFLLKVYFTLTPLYFFFSKFASPHLPYLPHSLLHIDPTLYILAKVCFTSAPLCFYLDAPLFLSHSLSHTHFGKCIVSLSLLFVQDLRFRLISVGYWVLKTRIFCFCSVSRERHPRRELKGFLVTLNILLLRFLHRIKLFNKIDYLFPFPTLLYTFPNNFGHRKNGVL